MKSTSFLFSSVAYACLSYPALSLELGGGYVQDRIGSCIVEVFSDAASMAVGINQLMVPNGQLFGEGQIISGLRQSISVEALTACGVANIVSVHQDGLDEPFAEDDFYGFEYTITGADGSQTYRYGFEGSSNSSPVSGLVADEPTTLQIDIPPRLIVEAGQSLSIPVGISSSSMNEVSVVWTASEPDLELISPSTDGVVMVAPMLAEGATSRMVTVSVEASDGTQTVTASTVIEIVAISGEHPVEDPEEPGSPPDPDIDQDALNEQERAEKLELVETSVEQRSTLQLAYQPSLRSLRAATSKSGQSGVHLSTKSGQFELSPIRGDGFWSYLRGAYAETESSSSKYVLATLGADLLALGGSNFGAVLQFDHFKLTEAEKHYESNGWMFGAYLYGDIVPEVLWYEAMWLHGRATNAAGLSASETDDFSSKRNLASFALGGELDAGAYTLLPSFKSARIHEVSEGYTSASGSVFSSASTVVLEYSSALEVIVPVAVQRGSFDVSIELEAVTSQQIGDRLRSSIGLNRNFSDQEELFATITFDGIASGGLRSAGIGMSYFLTF